MCVVCNAISQPNERCVCAFAFWFEYNIGKGDLKYIKRTRHMPSYSRGRIYFVIICGNKCCGCHALIVGFEYFMRLKGKDNWIRAPKEDGMGVGVRDIMLYLCDAYNVMPYKANIHLPHAHKMLEFSCFFFYFSNQNEFSSALIMFVYEQIFMLGFILW